MKVNVPAILVTAGALSLVIVGVASATGNHHQPEVKKVNICHKNSSIVFPWLAIEVPESSLNAHLNHGDFKYQGPVKSNGEPTLLGYKWCKDNVPPVEEPEVCPNNPQLPKDSENCVPDEPETPPTPPVTPPVTPTPPQVTPAVVVEVEAEITSGK